MTLDTYVDIFDNEIAVNETQVVANEILGNDEVNEVVRRELLVYWSAASISRKWIVDGGPIKMVVYESA